MSCSKCESFWNSTWLKISITVIYHSYNINLMMFLINVTSSLHPQFTHLRRVMRNKTQHTHKIHFPSAAFPSVVVEEKTPFFLNEIHLGRKLKWSSVLHPPSCLLLLHFNSIKEKPLQSPPVTWKQKEWGRVQEGEEQHIVQSALFVTLLICRKLQTLSLFSISFIQ